MTLPVLRLNHSFVRNRWIIVYILCLFFTVGKMQHAKGQSEYITVHGDQTMDTSIVLMQGLCLGGMNFDIPKTQELDPAFWVIGWKVDSLYDYIRPNFNSKIMVNVATIYQGRFTDGFPSSFKPWLDNWVAWDGMVDTLLQFGFPARPVQYATLFGEPDNDFTGTPGQFIEMYRRTDSIFQNHNPNAHLVGPDYLFYGINKLLWFVDTLDYLGVELAAVSWHEFNTPEQSYQHVSEFRDSLAARPWLGNLPIFIPEFGSPDNRLIPGWSVGWRYYFELADIDFASYGCFGEVDAFGTPWSDCWDGGLSGMYMQDDSTTQPLYWIWRAYAELNQDGRLLTSPSQPKTLALASKNDANQEMKIIVGRYDSPFMGTQNASANVQLTIRHYPYGNNSTQTMVIQKIPAQTVPYTIPLSNPITIYTGTVTFAADSAIVPLNSFADGDAYVIYINPAAGSILSTDEPLIELNEDGFSIELYPNPTSDYLTFTTNQSNITDLSIYDVFGKLVYQNSGFTGSMLNIQTGEFANGMYILRATNYHQETKESRFIVRH